MLSAGSTVPRSRMPSIEVLKLQPDRTLKAYLDRGLNLIASGNYDEAMRLFGDATAGRVFGVAEIQRDALLFSRAPSTPQEFRDAQYALASGGWTSLDGRIRIWFAEPGFKVGATMPMSAQERAFWRALLHESCCLAAEEWCHAYQHSTVSARALTREGGSLIGRNQHWDEIDLMLYMGSKGVRFTDFFMSLYRREETLRELGALGEVDISQFKPYE